MPPHLSSALACAVFGNSDSPISNADADKTDVIRILIARLPRKWKIGRDTIREASTCSLRTTRREAGGAPLLMAQTETGSSKMGVCRRERRSGRHWRERRSHSPTRAAHKLSAICKPHSSHCGVLPNGVSTRCTRSADSLSALLPQPMPQRKPPCTCRKDIELKEHGWYFENTTRVPTSARY